MTVTFVSWLLSCTGGNEPRGVSAGSSLVETAGSVREELEEEHHFARGQGPRLSTELLNRGAWPSRGLPFA